MNDDVREAWPLRLCAPEVFARARAALREGGLTEAAFRESLKLDEASDLGSLRAEEIDWSAMGDARRLLLNTFVFGELAPRMEFERVLGPRALDALLQLDLVREAGFEPGSLYSPVFLYPVGDLLVASDRHNNPDGSPFTPPADIVFPAINVGTLLFLRVIPRGPVDDALDLGGGTGVGALTLSAHARRSVSADITPRCSHFARFNALLNGRANVEVVEGDLYEPVAGRAFDLVVSHPPFVPALGGSLIYRDGGATGEALVRRIVEGLPLHLRPGGTFCCVMQARDTREGRFEERVRGWLGAAGDEFDIVFAVGEDKSVKEFVSEVAYRRLGQGDAGEVERMARAVEEAGTTNFAYGALVARRRRAQGPPWTARRGLSRATRAEDFARALRWRDFETGPDFRERLARLKPRLAPCLVAHVKHRVEGGALAPSDFLLETDAPFPALTRTDAWVVTLLTAFGGAATCAEVYDAARGTGALPEALAREGFLDLVAYLVERGFLTVDDAALEEGRRV